MIVLSASMPKAGSAWYFNLTNDPLVTAGLQDVHAIRERYHLHSILKYVTCEMARAPRLARALVLVPHFCGNTFVIKAHTDPTRKVRLLISSGIVKATYIYQDPRDAALSAFEHGCGLRQEGRTNSFARLETMEAASMDVRKHLAARDAWQEYDRALMVRYEDLVADPVRELERLAEHLALDVPGETLSQIVATYRRENPPNVVEEKGRLHFHKGIVGRFREAMSEEHLAMCREQFGSYLARMGYEG